MLVGKAGGPSGQQDEINGLIVGLAKAGRRVVRLKGGNPAVDEEIAACRKAGIAVEAIPGIATAQRAVTPVPQDSRLASLG
jgi:uroporphyrin-III C-methyltransferase/precorrin-2 dehydrogenase/sirohydrochlorin ferrochelatase